MMSKNGLDHLLTPTNWASCKILTLTSKFCCRRQTFDVDGIKDTSCVTSLCSGLSDRTQVCILPCITVSHLAASSLISESHSRSRKGCLCVRIQEKFYCDLFQTARVVRRAAAQVRLVSHRVRHSLHPASVLRQGFQVRISRLIDTCQSIVSEQTEVLMTIVSYLVGTFGDSCKVSSKPHRQNRDL